MNNTEKVKTKNEMLIKQKRKIRLAKDARVVCFQNKIRMEQTIQI